MHPILARPTDCPPDARSIEGVDLADALLDSRRRTLSLVENLSDAQWQVPYADGINPVAWELGHLAWFAEFWILRGPHVAGADGAVEARLPARTAAPDTFFDSARIAHATRWQVALPSRPELMTMLRDQLDACVDALSGLAGDDALYFHRLALFHEDMHAEALTWLRARLGYPVPDGLELAGQPMREAVRMQGGGVRIGWQPGCDGFAFDNELPSCIVNIAPFEVDAQPLTAGEFLSFVESDGYANPDYWPGEGGAWLVANSRRHPSRWRKVSVNGPWQTRWFDKWEDLDPRRPVIHVNAFEADAYCRWAGRRLPTPAEFEYAVAETSGGIFHWGHSVWEWTQASFEPCPGFEPGPYRDYSQPWFGSHRELRGGSFSATERMHDARYRNFFLPHRDDLFAGFRTVRQP